MWGPSMGWEWKWMHKGFWWRKHLSLVRNSFARRTNVGRCRMHRRSSGMAHSLPTVHCVRTVLLTDLISGEFRKKVFLYWWCISVHLIPAYVFHNQGRLRASSYIRHVGIEMVLISLADGGKTILHWLLLLPKYIQAFDGRLPTTWKTQHFIGKLLLIVYRRAIVYLVKALSGCSNLSRAFSHSHPRANWIMSW